MKRNRLVENRLIFCTRSNFMYHQNLLPGRWNLYIQSCCFMTTSVYLAHFSLKKSSCCTYQRPRVGVLSPLDSLLWGCCFASFPRKEGKKILSIHLYWCLNIYFHHHCHSLCEKSSASVLCFSKSKTFLITSCKIKFSEIYLDNPQKNNCHVDG